MCGIVAYAGKNEVFPLLIDGLEKLEYRGYDSTGIAIISAQPSHKLEIYKKKGKVSDLMKEIGNQEVEGRVGIGHTRWATHGKPNDVNAHPHTSSSKNIALVHNGIIENFSTLKEALTKLGHEFESDTDTEVFVHLIEEYQNSENLSLEDAVRLAMDRVVGAYAIAVIDRNEPDRIIAARQSSPLVLGVGDDELFVGSDASPFIAHTNKVVYLKDGEIVIAKTDGTFQIKNKDNEVQPAEIRELDMKIEALEKGGYDHFMLKEIFQQGQTVRDCMRGRVNAEEGWLRLGGVEENTERFLQANRIIFTGCGSSWHAGLLGEYLLEDFARIPVEVEYASELRYRNPVIRENDLVIALSQSGETADTIAALKDVKSRGAFIYGVVNVVGSSIARLTDAGSYIHAGPEIGVASTKAFTAQVVLLAMMGMRLAQKKGTLSERRFRELLWELDALPDKIDRVLNRADQIRDVASQIDSATNALYLGRGYNFPAALEGALKLKEISYIHAEGYPAAEMKHGPIALIDENMPVIVLATNTSAYEKVYANIQEVKARKGIVISIVSEGDKEISAISDMVIEVPRVAEPFSPILTSIPLQLLSYYCAINRGCNVDQPRNLAKSVTVE